MKDLTIKEVSELMGVSTHTIRYYEKEGLLTNVARTDKGYRTYDMKSLAQLESIILLRESGVALASIKAIWKNCDNEEYTNILEQSLSNVNKEIKRLRDLKVQLSKVLSFRNEYREDYFKTEYKEKHILEIVDNIDSDVYASSRSLYEFYIKYIDTLSAYKNDVDSLYFLLIKDQVYLCKRLKNKAKDSVTFEKGEYLSCYYRTTFGKYSLLDGQRHLDRYAKENNIELEGMPFFKVSSSTSIAVGDPNNEIIEVTQRIKK